MLKKIFGNKRGQTSTEYLLLIVVGISFGLTFMKKMDEYVINNPNGIIGKPIKSFKASLESDSSGRYRTFPLRR